MNDLRTAAQQALEALEHATPTTDWSYMITALRSALAQQDEPVEPVAYFGSAYVNENGVHITTVLGPVAIPQDAKLYTAPPQRKPLTDEEAAKACGASGNLGPLMQIVRAVERAHGIKEN